MILKTLEWFCILWAWKVTFMRIDSDVKWESHFCQSRLQNGYVSGFHPSHYGQPINGLSFFSPLYRLMQNSTVLHCPALSADLCCSRGILIFFTRHWHTSPNCCCMLGEWRDGDLYPNLHRREVDLIEVCRWRGCWEKEEWRKWSCWKKKWRGNRTSPLLLLLTEEGNPTPCCFSCFGIRGEKISSPSCLCSALLLLPMESRSGNSPFLPVDENGEGKSPPLALPLVVPLWPLATFSRRCRSRHDILLALPLTAVSRQRIHLQHNLLPMSLMSMPRVCSASTGSSHHPRDDGGGKIAPPLVP